MYLEGIVRERRWAEEGRNGSIVVAFGVTSEGYGEIGGAAEGAKEDKAGWGAFLRSLNDRGLEGGKLFLWDNCRGLGEFLGEAYPEAQGQRCPVLIYRNVFSKVPTGKRKEGEAMLKGIPAQEYGFAYRR
ncbi:MAG: transposase [Spirochaetales bacterium]